MLERQRVSPDQLSPTIDRLILGRPMPRGRRLLGIEYERLVLRESDDTSAPLSYCRDLMARLCTRFAGQPLLDGDVLKGVRADRFELSMEPGGQLEVACDPVARLSEVEAIMRDVEAGVRAEMAGSGFVLRGIGHVPVTPVEDLGLLPRTRYEIMNRRMPSRGPLSRNMMRATAGFQLTYDIEDRDDAARKLALLYRLSPLFVALSANSRRIVGRDSGWASYRHHVWWETDWMRSGVPAGCMHAATAIEGYIRYAREAEVLFLYSREHEGQIVEAPALSLEGLCERGELSVADIELHLTSLFPFVRLRNYLEVRCLDSIEWDFARSMLALISGVVYCAGATANAETMSVELLVEDPEQIRALHLAAAKQGLDAKAPSGRSLRELARELVGFASRTLGRATCDWAELRDLDEVRARIG